MNILVLGDIFGRPARKLIKDELSLIRKEYNIDFVVANGENASSGNGITLKNANELLECGIDVLTGGNHIWDKKEIFNFIQENKKIIRPANYPEPCAGRGYEIFRVNKARICVINLSGTVYMNQLDNPFNTFDKIYEIVQNSCDIILLDFHAEATSEKIAMGYYVDSRASAVWGTHTHVQTADERILPKGTGFITDVGMCGPLDGVIGVKKEAVIKKFKTQRPSRFEVETEGKIQLNGLVLNFDDNFNLEKLERVYRIF